MYKVATLQGARRFGPALPAPRGKARNGPQILDYCFALALVSLFSGVSYDTAFVRLRPFEVLSLVCVLGVLATQGPRILAGVGHLGIAFAFFAIHAASAFASGASNGMRETFQVVEVSAFALALLAHYRTHGIRHMLRIFSVSAIAIMLYAAWWHITEGFLFGWKRLGDPKSAFLLLPVIVSAWLAGRRSLPSPGTYALLFLIGLFLFFSGERKAYLVTLFALLIAFGPFSLRLQMSLALVVVAAFIATVIDPQGYLAQQIFSLISPNLNPDWVALSYNEVPQSFSNAQRTFAFDRAVDLFLESPLIGVGTNVYVSIVQNQYWYLPVYLTIGVHNEFQRVLVENGLLGISVYVSAWIVACLRLLKSTNMSRWKSGLSAHDRTRVIFFFACLSFCFLEASKTLSHLALVFALLSDVIVPAKQVSPRDAVPAPRMGGMRSLVRRVS